MKIIDLSQTLENGMPVYPGAPDPTFEKFGNVKDGDVYELTMMSLTTHLGTHLDCNSHVLADGFSTDTQDLSFFTGKGIVLDCSKYVEGDQMGMEIFENVDMTGVEFVLIYCDWAKYWGEEKFVGKFPHVNGEVMEYLANNKTIKGLGVEPISIDPLDSTDLGLHHIFMAEEKTVIECLTNLDQLIGKDFTFMALPLKIKNGDGSPVRAIAILD